MALITERIRVRGMSCASCEQRIDAGLAALDGVFRVKASHTDGTVEIQHDDSPETRAAILEKLSSLGYPSRPARDMSGFYGVLAGLFLSLAFIIAERRGLLSSVPVIEGSLGLGALFLAGVLTSLHCVGMCGGIALSRALSAKAESGTLARLKPSALYNVGRVISYTLIGGIVGGLGSVLSFSLATKAVIMALAAVFMVIFGLRNLGIVRLPPLPLPAAFRTRIDAVRLGIAGASAGRGSLVLGMLNGLMPCGPLQAMQLYALGTGNPLSGALSMFMFSLGTLPLLLGFGAAAIALPRKLLPLASRASAVLVLSLGLVTASRAAALAGLPLPADAAVVPQARTIPAVLAAAPAGIIKAVIKDGVQTVITEIGASEYPPFIVQKGIPVRWIVRVAKANLNGCNNAIVVPAFGIQKKLKVGDNLIEFTPEKSGAIPFSCWMGMIRSRITVVDALAAGVPGTDNPQLFSAGIAVSAGGASCACCSALPPEGDTSTNE